MEVIMTLAGRRPCGVSLLLMLMLIHCSCAKSGLSPFQGSKTKPDYHILSDEQADELFRGIRSSYADIGITQQFFKDNSFYFKRVQALRQESRVACIAFYESRAERERLGVLVMKLRGDNLVETISGILWLTPRNPSFPNEIEGPRVTSSSTMSLSAWWSCVFNSIGMQYPLRCRDYNPDIPSDKVACLEESYGLPMVYVWFRHCY
ncbi:MAG: hypothetical protein C4574_00420 [Candidatus Latescibacterota bacterium]|jgi:hypothetical protein|nr:MAG: hypothetical protein C4574_00420 [Candidatus Latescibacterota bacterium]